MNPIREVNYCPVSAVTSVCPGEFRVITAYSHLTFNPSVTIVPTPNSLLHVLCIKKPDCFKTTESGGSIKSVRGWLSETWLSQSKSL